MEQTIRIGTRGSQLALYQANVVKEELERKFPEYKFQIVVVKTKGDKILDVPLSKIGDKGLFTKELEIAMFDNEIDMAVHSLKDLPTRFPEGVVLGAVLKRGEVRDALISSTKRRLAELTTDDVIATSSLRRKAQLLRINKDFKIVEIRGNVNTRIRKMEEGYCTVMVMAGAGLMRLGMDQYISEMIDPDLVIPACSQGAIAIEIREDDQRIARVVSAVNDRETLIATDAERAFLRTLEGGCQIPVGSYSRIIDGKFELKGFISSISGEEYLCDSVSGPVENAVELSVSLAQGLLNTGGREILKNIRLEDPFEKSAELPLRDRIFISTRAPEAGDTLPDLVAAQGGTLLSLPMIEIKATTLLREESDKIKQLGGYDWLFFTSRNGVVNFFGQLISLTGSTELPSSLKVAVVGAKTASELEYYGYSPAFTSSSHGSAEMAAEFLALHQPSNRRILVSLGNLADDTLTGFLAKENLVDRINVYETCRPEQVNPAVLKQMAEGRYDMVLFTSPSTFNHFCSLVDTDLLRNLKIASIGATTSRTIHEAGFEPLLTAKMSSAEGLTEAIVKYYQQL
jgi:hydroxymethylbilane synthase